MRTRSSTASRVLVCLVALLVCGAGTIGIVAAATGGSATLETDGDSLSGTVDETEDDLEETTNETSDDLENTTETTDDVENTTDETEDELENTTDETTDELEESTNETTEGVEDTTDETTDDVDETVDETTDELEETTETVDETVDETADTLENATETTTDAIDDVTDETTETVDDSTDVVDGGGELDATIGPVKTNLGVSTTSSTDSSDSEDETDATGASGSGGGSGGVPAIPSGASPATDAVLVGLLGVITAAGAAAGTAGAAGGAASAGAGASAGVSAATGSAGAAGSAGGGAATGGATGLTASWLGKSTLLRHLRRAGSVLPWELVPIFRYSRYDDSDPLENDRRRTIYETIADDPGCYLSQVSEESDVALSTVRHHVRILEEEGLISATKVNGKRRYYLEDDARTATGGDENGDGDGTGPTLEDAELHAALAEPSKRAVLEALAELDAAPNGRLAEELDRDPSTVSHHLSALEENGLVVREKEGRSVVNELAPDVEAALRDAGAFEEAETEAADQTVSAPADD